MGILSASSIANLAKAHGINVREVGERVELLEQVARGGRWEDHWVNATGWTIRDLMDWLGY